MARREGYQQNIEIYFLTRFLEFVHNQGPESLGNIPVLSNNVNKRASDPILAKSQNVVVMNQAVSVQLNTLLKSNAVMSPRTYEHTNNHYNSTIKRTVIKEIGYMLSKFESS